MAKSRTLDLDKKSDLSEKETRLKLVEQIAIGNQFIPQLGKTLISAATTALIPPKDIFPTLTNLDPTPLTKPLVTTTRKSTEDVEDDTTRHTEFMISQSSIIDYLRSTDKRDWYLIRIVIFGSTVAFLNWLGVIPTLEVRVYGAVALVVSIIVLGVYWVFNRGKAT